jgi:putative DNA primase/helicase
MNDPRPKEFMKFHELLTMSAPEGYVPWYFRCEKGSKAPDTTYGSWKDETARLSVHEAIEWMRGGGNVGIAGTDDDRLVNVDIDDEDATTIDDLKPTLIARSRSRTGCHGWYFREPDAEIPNIPTDAAGEVRTAWQFVVAPGSYVETIPGRVPADEREDAGYYTIERTDPVAAITLDELPDVFRETREEVEHQQAELKGAEESSGRNRSDERHPLFEIEITDLVRHTDSSDRWESLFHGSDTGENTCVSQQGLLHCWRHSVSHNGYTAMVVFSGYQSCQEAGTPHEHSGTGPSRVKDDAGAMANAWKWAKQNGHLGADVRPPVPAMDWLVEKVTEGDSL